MQSKGNFCGKPKDCLDSVRTLSHSALCPRNFCCWTMTVKPQGTRNGEPALGITTPLTSASLVCSPNEVRDEPHTNRDPQNSTLKSGGAEIRDCSCLSHLQPKFCPSWDSRTSSGMCLLCAHTNTTNVCLFVHSDHRDGPTNYSKSFLQGTENPLAGASALNPICHNKQKHEMLCNPHTGIYIPYC